MKLFLAANAVTDEVRMFLTEKAREAFLERTFDEGSEMWIERDGESRSDPITAAPHYGGTR